ncbi:MAG: glycosyltransferase family 39 protein, partial [Candidatus Promineifilaceae bacterium]
MRKKHALPLLVWTGIWGLFFLTILLGWQRLPTSDFTEQFHTFAAFQAGEMLHGRLPLWSPRSFAGVPFVADPQAAVFYLPRWLTIFLSAPWGFSLYALELEALLHVWLAGAFAYALAYDITRRREAGLLGAVAFGLGGYLISYPLLQLSVLETITWLPLMLFLLRRATGSGQQDGRARPVPFLIATGLVWALSATAGHPQTLLHVSYTLLAYYLFLTIRARWPWQRILLFGAVIAFAGIGAAAAYWLPIIRYLPLSIRAEADYAFVATGLPMLDYLQTLAPSTLSLWSPEYLGIAAVMLAVLAWLLRRVKREQTAEILFWSVLILVACWVALGDAGILFQLVYYVLPGFSLFRQQERLLGVAALGGAMLAAQGLSLWLILQAEQQKQLLKKLLWIFATLFGLLLVILVATRSKPQPGWPAIFIRQTVLAAFTFLLLWRVRQGRRLTALLILLLVGDLFVVSQSAEVRADGPPNTYWQQPAWLEPFQESYQETAPARVDTRGVFVANIGELYGWEDIGGISPIKPQVLAEIETLLKVRKWQLLNVTHVISDEPLDLEGLTPLMTFQGGLSVDREKEGFIYRFDDALPRAWMVYETAVAADDAMALAAVGDPNVDLSRQVVLAPGSTPAETTSPESEAAVTINAPQPGQLTISLDTETAGYLVVSEWNYPGWRAWIDGEPTPIQQADLALQAIPVPAGAHHIEFRFRPPEVPIGIIISLLTLVASFVVAWRWRPSAVVLPSSYQWPRLPIPDIRFPALDLQKRLRLTRQTAFVLILGIVFLGFALRVFDLGVQELRGDGGISYGYAIESASNIITSLRDRGNPHSPLHYLLLHGWMILAGDSEFALRYISVVASLMALPLTYLLGRKMDGRPLGLLFAGLMAISQGLIWISQDVRNQYTLTILFSLSATLILLEALKWKQWLWWAFYAVAAALTIYAHYYGMFALFGHAAFLVARRSSRATWTAWIASGIGAFLLFLPWLAYSLPSMITVGRHFSRPTTPKLAAHLTDVGIELASGTAVPHGPARWIFIILLLLGIFGLRDLWHRKRPSSVFLIVWLVTTLLGIYLVRFSRDTFNNYYVSVANPAWWGMVAVGLLALWHYRQSTARLLAPLMLLFILGTTAFSLQNYYFDPTYSRSLGYRDAVTWLAEEVQPGDVIVTNYPDASLSYYLRDFATPRTIEPAVYQGSEADTNEELSQLADEYDRLWFAPVLGSSWDPDEVAFRWLDYHMLLEKESTHQTITFSAYRPLAAAIPLLTPINQTVSQAFSLEGAYLTVDGQPFSLRQETPIALSPGAEVEVSLVWTAESEISTDY